MKNCNPASFFVGVRSRETPDREAKPWFQKQNKDGTGVCFQPTGTVPPRR